MDTTTIVSVLKPRRVGIPRLAIVPYSRYREHCRAQVILKRTSHTPPPPLGAGLAWREQRDTRNLFANAYVVRIFLTSNSLVPKIFRQSGFWSENSGSYGLSTEQILHFSHFTLKIFRHGKLMQQWGDCGNREKRHEGECRSPGGVVTSRLPDNPKDLYSLP